MNQQENMGNINRETRYWEVFINGGDLITCEKLVHKMLGIYQMDNGMYYTRTFNYGGFNKCWDKHRY